jgi:hypothetical protein
MSDTEEQMQARNPIRPAQASAQASEFLGFMGSVIYDLGDGDTFELPNPSLMPPDMKARYTEHLRCMAEDLDTKDQTNPITGEVTAVQQWPLRKDGKLINDEELLCVALMGEKTYRKFLKAGGVPGQINTAWQMMRRQFEERLKLDSKSS